jgi:hypothetical protein
MDDERRRAPVPWLAGLRRPRSAVLDGTIARQIDRHLQERG